MVIPCCEVMMMISMICMNLLRDSVGSEYHHFHRYDIHLFLHDYILINIINKNAEGQVHHMTPLKVMQSKWMRPDWACGAYYPHHGDITNKF